MELRIILRMVEPTDSSILLGRSDAAHLDAAIPGRGYKRGKTPQEVQIALPVVGEDDDEQNQQLDELVTTLAKEGEKHHVQPAPAIRLLPEYVRLSDLLTEVARLEESEERSSEALAWQKTLRLYLGIEDLSLQPITIELSAETPHFLVGGGPGSGRTSVLQTCLFGLAHRQSLRRQHRSPLASMTVGNNLSRANLTGQDQANKRVWGTLSQGQRSSGLAPALDVSTMARIILVDFRRTSHLLRSLPGIWMYTDTGEDLVEVVETLKRELQARTALLRQELQHEGEEEMGPAMAPIVLVIDDYDMLSILAKNPLHDLKEFLLRARDQRFHIITAGSPSDLARTDPLLQQVRACRVGLVLGGDPADQPLLGVRISDLPPGKGYLVRRNRRYLVQVAHPTVREDLSRITQVTYATDYDQIRV
jgi:S-DNA-T family DNA segregation ATPase FtsK/SpoIIIE